MNITPTDPPPKQYQFLLEIMDSVGAYVFIKDRKGRYTYANAAVRTLFGRDMEDIVGHDDSEFFSREDSEDIWENDRKVMESRQGVETEERNVIASTGEVRYYLTAKQPLIDENGQVFGMYGISTDITAQKHMEQEMERLAQTDELTGITNRRHFLALAHHEFERFLRHTNPLVVILFDVDYFKRVNDRYGHHVGDQVLVAIAQACSECVRASDVIARIGGEEFAVLLPETRCDEARILAERLRSSVENLDIHPEDGVSIKPTISIGIAEAELDDQSLDQILIRADHRTYEAKEQGRNRIHG